MESTIGIGSAAILTVFFLMLGFYEGRGYQIRRYRRRMAGSPKITAATYLLTLWDRVKEWIFVSNVAPTHNLKRHEAKEVIDFCRAQTNKVIDRNENNQTLRQLRRRDQETKK